MKLQKWKSYSTDEIVALACDLYAALSGQHLEPSRCVEVWRDDSLKGKSAMYTIEHGFLLGSAQQGLTVRVTESWADGSADDHLVSTSVRVQACGGISFSLQQRLGQLTLECSAEAEPEARCQKLFESR